MKKSLIIVFLFLLGCGGGGNIINMSFPDSVSLVKEEADYIYITSRADRKWLLITGEGEKIDSGNLGCAPIKNMAFLRKFFIFCEKEDELKVEIYTHERYKDTLKLTGEIQGIFTGSVLCDDGICFTVYKDGKTIFYKIVNDIKELFSKEGICIPLSLSSYICDGILYPDKVETPDGGLIFPDQISGPILSIGREISVLKDESFVHLLTLKGQPLSFLSFDDKMLFFDILGYARIIDRKTLEETSISCGSYPVSATATVEERVYVLNELNPSITVLDLKGMKEIKTIW